MNLRIRTLALVPVVALAVTACGSASEEDYSDSMSSGLSSAETQPLSGDKADCVSEAFVGRIGTDRLGELGDPADLEASARSLSFPALNLTEAEGNELFDDFVDCGADMGGRVVAELAGQGLALPEQVLTCLENALSDGQMRGYFVPLMRSGETQFKPPVLKKIERKLVRCADKVGLEG